MSQKQNLKTLLDYTSIVSSNEMMINDYLACIYDDISSYDDHISRLVFKNYNMLPLIVSNKLYNLFKKQDQKYLSKKDFCKGLSKMYFLIKDEGTIRLIFDLFDFDYDGYVSRVDMILLLKHFHMINNSIDINRLIELLGQALPKEIKYYSYNEWNGLLKNNSDVFLLTLFFLLNHNPFNKDNLNYYLINFYSNINSQDKSNNDNNIITKLGDSSRMLFDYLNDSFNQVFIYDNQGKDEEEIHSLNTSLDELSLMEQDKTLCFREIEQKGLSPQILTPGKKLRLSVSKPLTAEISCSNFIGFNNEDTLLPNNQVESKTVECHSFSYFHFLQYEIETYYTNSLTKSKFHKYKLILLDNELFLTDKRNTKLNKVFLLNQSIITNHTKVTYNKKQYYCFQINKYCLNQNILNTHHNNEHILSYQTPNTYEDEDDNHSELSQKHLFLIEDKEYYSQFYQRFLNRHIEKKFNDKYEIINQIGQGTFGKVLKVMNKITKDIFAAKVLDKNEIKVSDLEDIYWELDIFNLFKKADCPYLVKAYEKIEDMTYIYLIFEYMPDGNLLQYQTQKELSVTIRNKIIYQLIVAIEYLHSLCIIHRDLKQENILIKTSTSDPFYINIKVIDFGMSKIITPSEKANETYGSLIYIAPEVLSNKEYDLSADIWSIGMIIYSLCYNKYPFNGSTQIIRHNYESIILKGFLYPQIDSCKQYLSIMKDCLNYHPNKRITATDLLHRIKCLKE